MLAACGVGYGDEVIVPPFTFIATIESVLLAGALPVFAEIDETLCMSAEGIRAVCGPKTKAVLLVHMCGAAADLDGIMAVCKEKNVMLIEDTRPGPGRHLQGQAPRHLHGKMGSFSFDFFKINTCGEGGVIITDDHQLIKTPPNTSAITATTTSATTAAWSRTRSWAPTYRIGEINAAIGLAQARKLPYIISQQRKHKAIIQERLSQDPRPALPQAMRRCRR